MNKLLFVLFISALITFTSCSKDEETTVVQPTPLTANLELNFMATGGGIELLPNSTFKDPLGRTMKVSRFKYYISNVYLTSSGSDVLVKDVELVVYQDIDIADPDNKFRKVSLNVPAGNYDGIKLGIGLDPILNSVNPAIYPPEHPLSAAQVTYWGAWSKYKFIMIEGFADLNGGDNLSSIYGYHTGFDTCYRVVSFSKPINTVAGLKTSLDFSIEINDIFFGKDTLDIATEPSWHGEETTIDRGIRISDNFATGLKLQ